MDTRNAAFYNPIPSPNPMYPTAPVATYQSGGGGAVYPQDQIYYGYNEGDERIKVERQISKWGFQVKLWAIVRLVFAIFSMISVPILMVTGAWARGILTLFDLSVLILVSIVGIYAGTRRSIHAARLYAGILILDTFLAVALAISNGVIGYEHDIKDADPSKRIDPAVYIAGIVTSILGTLLTLGACAFCAAKYSLSLDKRQEMIDYSILDKYQQPSYSVHHAQPRTA